MSLPREWSEEGIEAALKTLRGEIDQVPPMYSAKKVQGKKLYELARRGESVERKPVHVSIYEFEPIRREGQLIKDNLDGTFDFHARVSCSSGTYVRTLAEDFGKRLYVGAHLAELRRTRVGDFPVTQAITLEQLKMHFAEESLGGVLLPSNVALSRVELAQLAQAASAALARRITPVGTSADGDVIFATAPLAGVAAPPLQVETLAVRVLSRAIERAVRFARGRDGIPGLADEGNP